MSYVLSHGFPTDFASRARIEAECLHQAELRSQEYTKEVEAIAQETIYPVFQELANAFSGPEHFKGVFYPQLLHGEMGYRLVSLELQIRTSPGLVSAFYLGTNVYRQDGSWRSLVMNLATAQKIEDYAPPIPREELTWGRVEDLLIDFVADSFPFMHGRIVDSEIRFGRPKISELTAMKPGYSIGHAMADPHHRRNGHSPGNR